MASFLLSSLLLYKYWALLVVFFFSGLILPLPTSTVLLATGAFASQGYFDFFISLSVIVGANMLGDYTGYLIAGRYGRKVFDIMHVHVPVWMERLEIFLRKHPRSAIFATRFTGTTDVLTNLLCGFSKVSLFTFLLFDLLGNILSNGSLLYAGYFLGVHWQDFTGFFNISDYILIGIVVAIILSVIIWSRRHGHGHKA
jgi:membrane-associated protein